MLIYSNQNNLNTLKLYISSLFGDVNAQLKNVELTDIAGSIKRLPILELDNNIRFFSANAGSRHLFPPCQDLDQEIDELLEWEVTVLIPQLLNVFAGKPSNLDKENFKKCLNYLDERLRKTKFLVNDNISVGDIVVFSSIYGVYVDEDAKKSYLNEKIITWMKELLSDAKIQKAINEYSITLGTYKILSQSIPVHSINQHEISDMSSNSPNSTNTNSPSHQTSTDALSAEELEIAKQSWHSEHNFKIKPPKYPVVPVPGERNILITSALPYVNNVPHLGNIIGCVLSADCFARYCRLSNYNTLFICGTDEYGTATETKALAEGLTPQQICDKYFQIHNDIYRWFGIGFDHFGRTTTTEQTEICQEIFLKLNSNGFITTESVEQLFCPKCERFLADRFVEGGCPHPGCNYEDARGDQCDGCGKLINAIELRNPRCKLCSNTPKIQSSEQFFFDLPKIEPMLKLWMQSCYDGWSYNAKIIGMSWLKEGLKPRCITRDLKWGIPVPLEKYRNKVFYVWFDAPIGYLSITKRYSPNTWKQWWCPPKNVKIEIELFQFMAKDNVPFHAVMFPSTLLALNEGYTTVKHLMATEYLNYEDGKFSKSRGVGVFGNDAQETGIPADVWRFYLLYVRPESQDSSFSWVDLATKNNSELLNNLGNFINRALVFCEKNFNSTVPNIVLLEEDITLLALCNRELRGYVRSLEKCHLRDGIRHILAISRHGNQYMQANQPWVLAKGSEEEKIRAGTVIGICCNLACLLTVLIHPYMPNTSRAMKQQLNAPDESLIITPHSPTIRQLLPIGHKIGKPVPLFSKIDPARVEELKAKYGGTQNETNDDKKSISAVVANFETLIKKQEDKINNLKAKKADLTIIQTENTKLLELKKQLKDIKKGNIPKNVTNGKNTETVVVSNGDVPKSNEVNEELIKSIEAQIAEQGVKVRELKLSGVDKTVWQPEVNKLLDLKSQLVNAGGVLATPASSGKNKKSKK